MNNDKIPQSYKFTITADGPFGKVSALTYIVDMTNWRETQDQPAGTLHRLTEAVEKLTTTIADHGVTAASRSATVSMIPLE